MVPGANVQRRIADHLLSTGLIRLDAHRAALAAASAQGARFEDVVLDMGVIAEADLLKSVAGLFATRFVTTLKLSQATLDPRILALVPRRFAERHGVFPVLFDGAALTVATADPDDLQVLEDIKVASSVRDVRPIVARPAAVRAAIARGYQGDASAFGPLLRPKPQSGVAIAGLPASPLKPVGLSALELAHADAAARAASAQARAGEAAPPSGPVHVPVSEPGPVSLPTPPRPPLTDPARPVDARASHTELRAPQLRGSHAELRVSHPDARPTFPDRVDPTPLAIGFVRALVDLLEGAHPERRGHSTNVSRIARKLSERLGLPAAQRDAIALAGLVHDLGKGGPQHLTALHVAVYAAHKALGAHTHRVPEALLAPVELPTDTKGALASMYECFDGKGIPTGASGRQIPVGARVLAVADAFACITTSADHPGKKVLAPGAASALLAKFSGKIFDPAVIDALQHAVPGEELRAALLADRPTVLVVDPDPHARARLELRLAERGFAVRVATGKESALAALDALLASRDARGDAAQTRDRPRSISVVSELDLGSPDDSVNLRAEILPRAPDVLWMLYTNSTNDSLLEFMRELDVADVVPKSATGGGAGPDALVGSLVERLEEKQIRASDTESVEGTLAAASVGDVSEILAGGRKTCALQLRAMLPGGQQAEGAVVFEDGNIVDARLVPAGAPAAAIRGEEAFYALMTLRDGPFRVAPIQVTERTIFTASTESLLAEGSRRLP